MNVCYYRRDMLIDEAIITVKAGNGGNGAVSFRRNAQTAKGGPDGGNGGNGGSVFFQGSTNEYDLKEFQYKKKILAPDGIKGKKNNLYGKNGQDIIIKIPVGTEIIDTETGEHIEILDEKEKVCIARGGKGGKGNNEFKSATNQTPMFAEKGEEGEFKKIQLKLRIIADIGFVGLPNVGKSTLLSLLTKANPKIGNYPFTTLEPNVGVAGKSVLADIPGVIKGASKGKGLGIRFLKHIEKTRALFYCIDSTHANPYETYLLLRNEFAQYNSTLLEKPEVIVLTKCDLVDEDKIKEMKKEFNGKIVVSVSQSNEKSIKQLQGLIEKQSN